MPPPSLPIDDGVLLDERVALRVSELVRDDKIDGAKALVDALLHERVDSRMGIALERALSSPSGTRDDIIARLVVEARRALEAFVRRENLERRLDSRLRALAEAAANARERESVEVILLVTATDDRVLADLRHAGLVIDAVLSRGPAVAGRATIGALEPMALLPAVKRIEPVGNRF
ncbi:MAG: hypothetical protein HYR85_03045 [Planctomycetes bacterium]|nr:hypothetical protein [Planctomycetota bacterium]